MHKVGGWVGVHVVPPLGLQEVLVAKMVFARRVAWGRGLPLAQQNLVFPGTQSPHVAAEVPLLRAISLPTWEQVWVEGTQRAGELSAHVRWEGVGWGGVQQLGRPPSAAAVRLTSTHMREPRSFPPLVLGAALRP